ncbi:NAD(P)-dependent oxidoreductase [Limosilactobacillus reuteri]|uniref:NAD(P)-dependent oxidoreductase n=1 Tax=Limosilactobacillus reuteri TaxID=1598 RepID=UPI003D7762D3
MKIACYGVRPIEEPYFRKLNKYNYTLKLIPEFLDEKNGVEAQDCDAVLVRGNCLANAKNLELFASYGIKYVFTRTVGYNHIDLETANRLGIQVARVPNYSPYAVAELAMTLGMQLFRNTSIAIDNSKNGNFKVLPTLFSKEIHNSTVGIIGIGKIGLAEAKLYKGMGTKVLAYDRHPSSEAQKIAECVDLDTLLEQSDIVSIHVPYFPGSNENMINKETFKKMKSSAVFVNTARGELVNTSDLIEALQNNEIKGYAADVFIDEKDIMNHVFESIEDLPNTEVRTLAKLYPRVLLTPHIGSFTEPALEDMISISFENFEETLKTGSNKNIIKG